MIHTRGKSKTGPKKLRNRKKIPENSPSNFSEFINREVGWLNFNTRVINEAKDSRNPLLERVRFLSISHSNMDEFFMKRVGGLKQHIAFGITGRGADGSTAFEQITLVRKAVRLMVEEQAQCFDQTLKPLLAQNGIHLLRWSELNDAEKKQVRQYYLKNVFPVLTPLAVDPGHPFPFISNLSTSLGVTLKHPDREDRLFARVKVPKVLPQWIRIEGTNGESVRFVSLLDVIRANLQELFPAMQIQNVMAFRLTRNADILREEEDAEDLLEMITEELRARRFAEVVRVEHGPNPDPWMVKFLIQELELSEDDVFQLPIELDFIELNAIADLPLPNLKFEPWTPMVPPTFADATANVFALIRHGDILLHHPYESFSFTVERFIREASEDPKVLAIKMTLYRTGDNSPFVRALIRAAESGKQVVCLIELKARFDEERNIYWAQALENAGVHVVYGIVGLKTHAKTALVVRQDNDGLKCYAHIGTGNYNVTTSRMYTDLGLLTANEDITSEVVELFHYLTGRSLKADYKHLLVAPVNMVQKFVQMMEREREHAVAKRPAHIVAKFNNMEEGTISNTLYKASQGGVSVDLIIRGFCCLRPGVPGLSPSIRVISVVGRFLEHSRIFYFRNGQEDPIDGDFFIGSADWMYRNLHARVECVVPIYKRNLKEKIWEILQIMLKDQVQAREMDSQGEYKQRKPTDPQAQGTHMQLMTMTRQKVLGLTEDKFVSGETNN
jgi:polyphosphate kinase